MKILGMIVLSFLLMAGVSEAQSGSSSFKQFQQEDAHRQEYERGKREGEIEGRRRGEEEGRISERAGSNHKKARSYLSYQKRMNESSRRSGVNKSSPNSGERREEWSRSGRGPRSPVEEGFKKSITTDTQ